VSWTRTAVGLVKACHPEPTLAVAAGAGLLAAAAGLSPAGIATVTAVVFTSQLSIGWHNDWLDAERDAAVGRKDKPIVNGELRRRTAGIAAVFAAAATPLLALLVGWQAAVVALFALIGGLAYNWPLKLTPLSPLPYLFSFAALPAFVALAARTAPPWWLISAGAALGVGAHFANVLTDLDDDVATGVRGLPQRLGSRWSGAVAAVMLVTASVLLVWGPAGPPSVVALAGLSLAVVVLVLGGYGQLRRPQGKFAFRAVMVVAVIDVTLLLAAGTSLG
jgi:4-hydroxybenzoate polyprenyltransferase